MHAARLSHSSRLRRTLRFLEASKGKELSTRDIGRGADICAVNSAVAELRANGAVITCTQKIVDGARRFFYRWISSPEGWNA